MTDMQRSATQARVVDLLFHNARYFAAKPALRIDGQAISYGELERRVHEATQVLGAQVRAGDRVGLWLSNCHTWVVCFLALNALGAISVPINTRLTPTEVDVILRDAQAAALITTTHYRGRDYFDEAQTQLKTPYATTRLIYAVDDATPASSWTLARQEAAGAPPPLATPLPEDMLCIQYTSGTTATPKGVMLTNASYLRTAAYVARCQGLTPASNFISAGPFFHCSGSMHGITVCLAAGCTLNSMSVWDPLRFLDEVERHAISAAHACYLRDVIALGADRARPKLATLRVSHALGTPTYLQQLHDELGIRGISNIYGMTETSGQFTMWFGDDPLASRISANGRPQAGNQLRIADPHTGVSLAPGGQGEIQMRGPTITPGYFNRPQANLDSFTADGWLRSGDLGTLTENNELTYLARLKENIRVGGENLAPDEVEQALRDLTGIQMLSVVGMADARLDEVPALVVVNAEAHNWPTILGQLRLQLAGYKMPKAVFSASELPLTATNKVQRGLLKERLQKNLLIRVL